MILKPLPSQAPLSKYEKQAEDLLAAHKLGNLRALNAIHENHPRFLDKKVKWLPIRDITAEDIRNAPFSLADARLVVARAYSYRDWTALKATVNGIHNKGSQVAVFEAAAEAVITGDLAGLQRMLHKHPELLHARSQRVLCYDPPAHRATLLHYLAANGVEGYRQKSPANAVGIAKALLDAGADPNALADMYGEKCTVMGMLVSSTPPANAGVQVPLVNVLVDYGASVKPLGGKKWGSPLQTALVFGFQDAAKALVRRGAAVDDLASAAGLGVLAKARQLLPAASAKSRHRALALASQLGHVAVVRLLLDAGENPNRYNPPGMHAHSMPLHQAVCAGKLNVVKLLLRRGAKLDARDKIWHGTPLGWAFHCKQPDIERYLSEVIAKNAK